MVQDSQLIAFRVNKWAVFLDTVNRAAGGLYVSNWGQFRPFGKSVIFYNPVVGLNIGVAVQLQAAIH